ncbi:MAG: hypothetical protein M1812_003390 [Candelaria pacifica]|nr:MAG: hypothetical protein M1812_003390 [Candelaria pacifica]
MFSKPLALVSILSLITSGLACNNSPDLCGRSYSNITHLGAHDSAFVRDASTHNTIAGNQYFNATVQLDAGVRLLSAQVHNRNGEWHLCHTTCDILDAGRLSDWLTAIKYWMDKNPTDIVTLLLVNSDFASATALSSEFEKSKINTYAYTPISTTTATTNWPTLQSLISNSTRLVTFVTNLDPSNNTAAPYLLNEFTHIFETAYEISNPSNFSCLPDRPTSLRGSTQTAISSNRMPLMNHFLYDGGIFGIEMPNVANVSTTNAPSGGIGNLGDTVANCSIQYGKSPTFILVDFFDQGPAIQTVDRLNGVKAPVGRKVTGVSSGTAMASGGVRGKCNPVRMLVDLIKFGFGVI